MQKIKNINISFWFKELNYSPKDKLEEVKDSFKDLFNENFLFNEMPPFINIMMPRIEAFSDDKKMVFRMSQMNAIISINVMDKDNDEIPLIINENLLRLYSELKSIFGIEIIYTSVKIDSNEIVKNSYKYFIKNYNLEKDNYEDLQFKKVIIKDDYYICYNISTSKELNFNITLPKEIRPTEQDMINRSMLVSTSEATLNGDVINTFIEINDRYSYNQDKDYRTTETNLRGMVIEIKNIIENELKNIK